MTLYNSPSPLSSLHKNTGSHRFNSIILNTFLQWLGLSQPFTSETWCTAHHHEVKMAGRRTEGLSFPTVNSNTSTPGTLTCTVALSDMHIETLKKILEIHDCPGSWET